MAGGMIDYAALLGSNPDTFAALLDTSDTLALMTLDSSLRTTALNPCFRKLLRLDDDGTGIPVDELLRPESSGILPLPASEHTRQTRMTFKSAASSPLPLRCTVARTADGGYLIIGGGLMLGNNEILDMMSAQNNDLANMTRELKRKNDQLEEAQAKIKTLSGLIPICCHCKKIRDDGGYWNMLEQYITEHSEAEFSHGICPECLEKYYGTDSEET